MAPFVLGTTGFFLLLVFLALRVPIAFSLGSIAVACIVLFFSWPEGRALDLERGWRASVSVITSNSYEFIHSFELTMIPLFILLSNVAYTTRITTDIYRAARVWLTKLPGGLAVASVIGCGGFSAITGSSVACAAAMGRICVPEMLKANYGPRLATSSVAAGGTLGSLIPPSVPFILYGIFTETSISRLFLAGVLPGILTLGAFVVVILVWVRLNPAEAPPLAEDISARDRTEAAIAAWPAILLFAIVIGGIYGGFFTATEAAAVSAATAILIGFALKRLSFSDLFEASKQTVKQTAMLFLIAFAAKIYVSFISLTGLTPWLVESIDGLGLPNWQIIALLCCVFLILGMFLDPIGILLLTLPFAVPLVESAGLNLIWFGVIVIKLLEIGLITPPVGLNAFVIKSVVGQSVGVHTIFAGISRFLIAEIIVLGLLIAFPIISLLLPTTQF